MSRRSSFGSVYRKHRRDGTQYAGWYVRYTLDGKRHERFGGLTREQADAYLAAQHLAKVTAKLTGVRPVERIALRDWLPTAIGEFERICRPRGMKSRRTILKYFGQRYGARDVCDITADEVRAHLRWLRDERGYAVSSQHNALRVLAGLFRMAVERGVARTAPTRGLLASLPSIEVEEMPYLEPAELRRIYAAMPKDIRPAVVLLGEAGLRRHEAVGLLWSEVAPDNSRLTIRAERAKGKRFRVVPLTETASAVVKELRAARGAIALRGTDRVFGFSEPYLNEHFRTAADSIGYEWLTPHGLRHAFGSGLVRAGVDLVRVQRLLGHRDIKTTMRYASHAPDHADADAIRALSASRQAPPPAAASSS